MSEGFHIFNKLYFHPSHDPENISKLLYNALKKAKPVDGREQLNLQWVRFIGANEFGLEFVVAFDCTKRILKNSMQDSVMMEIHKTLRHAGVQMSAGKLYGKLEEDTGLHALDTHRSREDFEKRQVSEFNPYNESVKNRVLLQKIPIFMSLNSEDLDEIAENAERLHFEKDDYIIKQNDSGDSLYVINDGVVSVYLDNENKDKVFLAKLGVGDFVGEGSLLTGEPRSANVIAETPCIVIKVSKDIIKDIFSKNPNVYDYVANILAQRKLKLDKKKNESQLTKDENKNLVNDIKNAIINFLKFSNLKSFHSVCNASDASISKQRAPEISQDSSGVKDRISSSRSATSREATLCTRPALLPAPFGQRIGEVRNPTRRSRIRRARCASTRCMSMPRGFSKAF